MAPPPTRQLRRWCPIPDTDAGESVRDPARGGLEPRSGQLEESSEIVFLCQGVASISVESHLQEDAFGLHDKRHRPRVVSYVQPTAKPAGSEVDTPLPIVAFGVRA